MINIGYIGNGKSINRYHLPFVLQRDNLNVKTIYRRNANKDMWEKIPHVKYTSNIDDIIKDKEIDLVVICTFQDSHYEYARLALENNKHCLVEKPFMLNTKEGKEIFKLAKEKGLIVQCYQNRRFDSDFLTVQKVIEEGKLGEVFEIDMHFDYYRPESSENSIYEGANNSFLYGHGCHTIDQVISYFGKPDNIRYEVKQLLGEGKMNDYFQVDMYYGTLKISVKSSFFMLKERPSFVVYGKKGRFIKETRDRQEEHLKLFYMPCNNDFGMDTLKHYGELTYIDEDGIIHEEKVPSVNGDYGRVYDDLYEAIVNGCEKKIKDDETLLLMEILEKGIEGLK